MRRMLLTLALAACGALTPINTMAQTNNTVAGANVPAPPTAKTNAKTTDIHGETLTDNYFWLREKTSPEVIGYLEAENAYTDQMLKGTEGLQEALYQEMLGRIKQTDVNVPVKDGPYFYYSRTEQGKQYPILARRRGSMEATEEITLDLNEIAKGQKYTGLGTYATSDDHNLLAYSIDSNGFRDYILYVKDLRTGKLLPDQFGPVVNAFWAADNKTLFYVTQDAAKRPHKLFRHTLGEPKEKDVLVAEEKDELFRLGARRSRSRDYIFIGMGSSNETEYHYLRADRPADAPKLLLARTKDHEYYPEHHGQSFYIRTNDKGRNFRLVSAPLADPKRENWKEVIPHRADVTLEGTTFFKDFYVVSDRASGLQRLGVNDFKTGKLHYVEFPEPVYTAGLNFTPEFDTTVMRFGYQSFQTPPSVYDYDMRTRKKELKKQTEVLGGFDPAQYQSERVYAVAKDGIKVPVSLVYKKGVKRDGSSPMLLDAYGSYGIPRNVSFSSNRLSLLNRGVVFATAHIRGGSDLGTAWHDDGKMLKKKNTFTDFIAAAEHLIGEKYTSKDRLVITGGSAGGLLMGAVTNMRPDLFKAVVSYVPFVDVINTMLDASLPLTVQEYLE
ncbi:MAG: S9 family peptidase, partial [Pyrinomonadaceae bacterium]